MTFEHYANEDIIVRRWVLCARIAWKLAFAFALGVAFAGSLIKGGVR